MTRKAGSVITSGPTRTSTWRVKVVTDIRLIFEDNQKFLLLIDNNKNKDKQFMNLIV